MLRRQQAVLVLRFRRRQPRLPAVVDLHDVGRVAASDRATGPSAATTNRPSTSDARIDGICVGSVAGDPAPWLVLPRRDGL